MQQSYTVALPALNSGSLPGLHPERQEVVDNAEFVFQLLFTIELVFKVCILPSCPLSVAAVQYTSCCLLCQAQSELMVGCSWWVLGRWRRMGAVWSTVTWLTLGTGLTLSLCSWASRSWS